MSAAVMRSVGPPSVLKLETDFPQPLRSVTQLGSRKLQCSAVAFHLQKAAWVNIFLKPLAQYRMCHALVHMIP
jgi:hypothetical protein